MHGKHGRFLQSAFSPRLLVIAFSFLSSSLAALLAVTCFVLALDKRSDPNSAVSLPGSQKFATFFTAGVFLAVLPIPLITFLSACIHTRQRYSSSSPGSHSKLYALVTLRGLPLPPNKPFLLFPSGYYRPILAIAILIQLVDAVAFTTVVCIRQNSDICLFNGRVVLCNLLTPGQKLAVIIPGFLQISAQIALFFLIKHYTREVESKARVSTADFEIFAPISTSSKGGRRSQGPFQMVPGFDPDHPDIEKGSGDLTGGLYGRGYDPVVESVNEVRSNSYDYSTPYDDPADGASELKFTKHSKPTRSMSTSASGSQMQGPRPAPKRSATILSSASNSTTASTPHTSSPRKNKDWFKRFKSKTVEAVPADDEDESEAEGLVSGPERKRKLSRKKSDVSQGDGDQDADGEEEGLL